MFHTLGRFLDKKKVDGVKSNDVCFTYTLFYIIFFITYLDAYFFFQFLLLLSR